MALVPDSTRKYGVLKLDIVVENSYNGEEPITAGYDIYDPKGKLLDYGSREIMVEGRSRDTVHHRAAHLPRLRQSVGRQAAAALQR